jgi:positive control factor
LREADEYRKARTRVSRYKTLLNAGRVEKYLERKLKKKKKHKVITVETSIRQPSTDEETILTGVLDSLTYTIEWLEHNREPGLRRGADKAPKHRVVLMDPQSYQFVRIAVAQQQAQDRVSEEDRERLEDVLSILTPHEQEAYILVRGRGLSLEKTASLLEIKKATVQTLVDRAEGKIREAIDLSEVQRVMFTDIV